MPTELEALAAIETTFDTVTHWFERLRATYVPMAGSALAADDTDWPYMPVSQVAWVGLAGAADHLDAIRHQLTSRPIPIHPYAQLTLCRSALVGACQAVWVLAPDDPTTRRRRARTVAAYVYTHRLKYFYKLRELSAAADPNLELQISKDEERGEQLEVKRSADGQPKGKKLMTGEMIEDAIGEGFGQVDLTANANLLWQSGSGAAHGQIWPNFNTDAMRLAGPTDSGGPLTPFVVKSSLATFSSHYSAAFQAAERGWQLLDQRGVVWASDE